MFVDHAGATVPVIAGSPETRAKPIVYVCGVYVAVLGASSYTYAEATWALGLRDWISSHVRAFHIFQG